MTHALFDLSGQTAAVIGGTGVLGGGMADAGQMLFEPLIARLAKEVPFQPVPSLLPAALGNDAGYLGAALKAWLALGVSRSELNWREVV